MIEQIIFTIQTPGRGLTSLSKRIATLIHKSPVTTGICHLFLHHTSASFIIGENADEAVCRDLETFMQRIAPDGDPCYEHIAEGIDDMPAHIRAVLTTNFLSIPITRGELALGTWQGIYLWEHRIKAHERKVTVTIYGE